jgi:hypothetical protein
MGAPDRSPNKASHGTAPKEARNATRWQGDGGLGRTRLGRARRSHGVRSRGSEPLPFGSNHTRCWRHGSPDQRQRRQRRDRTGSPSGPSRRPLAGGRHVRREGRIDPSFGPVRGGGIRGRPHRHRLSAVRRSTVPGAVRSRASARTHPGSRASRSRGRRAVRRSGSRCRGWSAVFARHVARRSR